LCLGAQRKGMVITMKDDFRKLKDKFFEKIPEKYKKILIILLGVCVILLALLPNKINSTENKNESEDDLSVSQYINETEEKLSELILNIENAGKNEVMITVQYGKENIYATDINTQKSEYVIIGKNSDETGLLVKTAEPIIRGVAVCCEGGDNPKVQLAITTTVCSLLGISSNNVSITKMKNGEN